MNVRDRIRQGKNVRVRPLAEEAGISASAVYRWIDEKKLEAVEFQGTVTIPAHAAARLLGMTLSPASTQAQAA